MKSVLLNALIWLALSVVAFLVITLGIEWVYTIWEAGWLNEWVVPVLAIPAVASVCAMLIYLFFLALTGKPVMHEEP